MSWDCEFEIQVREDLRYESWLVEFDATDLVDYPESPDIGYVYVLGLTDGWIKVGKTWQRSSRRLRELPNQTKDRHGPDIQQVWKTPPLPPVFHNVERRVLRYASSLSDGQYATYKGGGRLRRETEMFHGVDFWTVRAYADLIGRCEVQW
ncbi:hypothetical protein ACIRRA_38400 [Nocardia sp. NPDC101769]|uniref:hypothetical protein n=1 Tax=Nocardia sp. NPDC101769 TaxID=3364333 RepID=UPI00381837CE